MSTKQYLGLLAVCAMMSLVGSTLVSSMLNDTATAEVAPPTGQTITAGRIELVDADGDIRGVLQVDPESGPQLVLNGPEDSKAVLGMDVLGMPEFVLQNQAGMRQIYMGITDYGGEVVISDEEETAMVEVYVDEKTFGVVEVLDEKGHGMLLRNAK